MPRLHDVRPSSSLAILGGLASTLVNGGVFYTFGVFFKPVMADLDLSRSQVSAVYSLFLIAYAPGAVFLGRLCDRYGGRLPMAGAALLVGGGLALCGWGQTLGAFLVGYALIGLGVGATLAIPSTIVQRWFVRGRGVALGIVSAGMGAGAMVFAPVANYLISSYSWPTAYLSLAVIYGALLAISAIFLVSKPRETAASVPAAAGTSRQATPGVSGVMRSGTFLGLLAIHVLSFAPSLMITAHLVPYATDRGMSPVAAATAIGLLGAISVPGRVIMGSLGQRIGWMRGAALSNFACALAVAWLAMTRSPAMLYPFVVGYGFFYAARMPQLMGGVASFYGTASLGVLLGTTLGVSTMTGAATPLLGGYLFDRSGSYTLAWAFATASFVAAGIGALLLRPPRGRAA